MEPISMKEKSMSIEIGEETILLLLDELGIDQQTFPQKMLVGLIEGILRSFAKYVDPEIKKEVGSLFKPYSTPRFSVKRKTNLVH